MHLTVRMAWHDNNWDGKICCKPEANTYCTGAHSLLSGRIEKKKDVKKEQALADSGKREISGNFEPSKVPPCYWSINAFSKTSFKVDHHHAFNWVKHVVKDEVKPYSVYTWPFKLSFNHGEETQKAQGNYPPKLDDRINNFIKQFEPKKSIIFFYANYDNPVSADDMKYLLMGCSVISELPVPKHFPFKKEELDDVRDSSVTMKNFPTMNWAIQFTHDPGKEVLLPYREYIKYAETHPEDEGKLQDMKVIIEESSLIKGFKYVAMDIDDDKCLYLLYKLRKSIKKIQEHNNVVIDDDMLKEEQRINDLIKSVWGKRGIYPSLSKVLNHFLEDENTSNALATAIIGLTDPKTDISKIFQKIIDEEFEGNLEDFEDELYNLSHERRFKKNIGGLSRLSLFNLTQYQISKIIDDVDFLKEIERNPYALYEEYVEDEDDLDQPQMQDEPMDVFKVDIGMIPDIKYVKRHRALQNYSEDSPERIRSVIINYLWLIGDQGHCYDHTYNLLANILEHPLIYKNDISIDEDSLIKLDSDYKSHFLEKLHIIHGDNLDFFYLNPVRKAEEYLKSIVEKLINRNDHPGKGTDINAYIEKCLNTPTLKKIIVSEEAKLQFRNERTALYKNIYRKSFFLLTGKPGAGKTYETSKIIEHLHLLEEDVEILAPTGKAALRITENIKNNSGIEGLTAKTIDKFIYDNKFGWAYEDTKRLENLKDNEKLTVENLIIDESSMIDLWKLKVLFSIIRADDNYPKRIIMVGDENQLPPIGFGKPFCDIINFVLSKENLFKNHYIHLNSNCRQENDPTILKIAEAFADKKRYYEGALDIFQKEGWVSSGLYIRKWKAKEELNAALDESLQEVFLKEGIPADLSNQYKFNEIFGLYTETGYVKNPKNDEGIYEFKKHLDIERLQLLTPYRINYFGTIGLNKYIQSNYRYNNEEGNLQKYFHHADKIIRISNWYWGKKENRRLVLSNGSIGIVTVKDVSFINKEGKLIEYDERKYYFKDSEKPFFSVDDEENFDLAYAISIHKSQGSDFKNVFLVIPKKQSLLSKELVYTALTRSKYRLYLFVQESDENILMKAKDTSFLLSRNTSIFIPPIDYKKKLIPDINNKPVKSRVEYIIYKALKLSRLKFSYEKQLNLEKRDYDIHPDFTIELKNGKSIFWEHLGMLDVRKYYKDWQQRKIDYQDHGYFNMVITTDDLNGINDKKIEEVIDAIRENNIKSTPDNKFSNHHYELY